MLKIDGNAIVSISAHLLHNDEPCAVCANGTKAAYLMQFQVESPVRGTLSTPVCRDHYEGATRDVEKITGTTILPTESLN